MRKPILTASLAALGARRRRVRRRRRRSPATAAPTTVAATRRRRHAASDDCGTGDDGRAGHDGARTRRCRQDHLALADGDRDALRDRRRRPGARRRRLLELSRRGGSQDARPQRIRAQRRGDRRARTRPRRHRRHQPRSAVAVRHTRDRSLGRAGGGDVRRHLHPDRAARRARPGTSPRRPSSSARCRPTSPR